MRLSHSAHTSRPWRIHEFTQDFRVEDVWALPTPGGPDDFHLLVDAFTTMDPADTPSRAARALFALRRKLGEIFGWDGDSDTVAFTPLYQLHDEFATEIVNKTVHGMLHLGWVQDGKGGYRGQMAVLVKPNGLFGRAYMAAIKPFRYLIVYPQLLKKLEREWNERYPEAAARR